MRQVATAVAVVVLLAASASAQRQRPGTAPQSGTGRRSGPVATGSVFGGYDAPLFATDALATLQPSGQSFSGANLNFSYARLGRSVALDMTADANTSYYPKFTPKWQPSVGAGVRLASAGQGKWDWGISNFAHYAPISNTGLFAGANAFNGQGFTLASGSAFQVTTIRQVNLDSSGSLTYSPTRRTHLQLLGSVGTLLAVEGDLPDNLRLNARVRAARDLARNFRGFIGYSVSSNRVAAFRGTPSYSYRIDGVDFGVDFSRPFQITRNTSVSFYTGVVKVPETGRKSFQLTGGATLEHYFLRTWTASVTATRDARFVQSFKDPVVFAALSSSVGGMLVGNLGASLSANYTKGTVQSPNFNSSFLSYSSAAQLRYDLRRLVAMFVEYSLFRSDIEATSDLAGYPTGAFGRHSIRGGLSFGLNPFRP